MRCAVFGGGAHDSRAWNATTLLDGDNVPMLRIVVTLHVRAHCTLVHYYVAFARV